MEPITMTLLWKFEISIRKKILDMKLYMQENQMPQAFRTIFLPTTLAEEDMAPCSRAFQKSKKGRRREEVNRKYYPKVSTCSEKVAFEKIFWNGWMVGKQKSSTRALRPHNWNVLHTSFNITAESLNFWLIKLVKEQSWFCAMLFEASAVGVPSLHRLHWQCNCSVLPLPLYMFAVAVLTTLPSLC